MKRLSIVVPSYNSENYLDKCIHRLPIMDERLDIIIVNDGSKDRTGQVAAELVKLNPATIRLINQENKGHGGACNTGIAAAVGQYVRILDSDDWLDREALLELLDEIDRLDAGGSEMPDLLITNYVYERLQKDGSFRPAPLRFNNVLPERQLLTWEDFGRFRPWQHLMMHSLTYRRELLVKNGFRMLEHCFYVDNLFAYVPLPSIRHSYYVNIDLYRYFIGREGQSVNEASLRRNLAQHIRVNREMLHAVNLREIEARNPHLYRYMFHYFEIITVTSSVLLLKEAREGNPDARPLFDELWNDIRSTDPQTCEKLEKGVLGHAVTNMGTFGENISLRLYKLVRKILGYN